MVASWSADIDCSSQVEFIIDETGHSASVISSQTAGARSGDMNGRPRVLSSRCTHQRIAPMTTSVTATKTDSPY